MGRKTTKKDVIEAEKLFILPSLLQTDYKTLMDLPFAQTSPFTVSARILSDKGIDDALLEALARQGFARKEQKTWKVVKPQRRKTAITVKDHNYTDDKPHPLLDQPVPERFRPRKTPESLETPSRPEPIIEPD